MATVPKEKKEMEWIPDDNAPKGNSPDMSRVDAGKTRRRVEDALRKILPGDRRLFAIAETLGVEVAMLPDLTCNCCDCTDPNRPNFGQYQVRHLCQIKKGLTYSIIATGSSYPSNALDITREPYWIKSGWGVNARRLTSALEESFSLPYLNVGPHEFAGIWQKDAWLAFTTNSEHLAGPHKDHCSCCRHHYHESQ